MKFFFKEKCFFPPEHKKKLQVLHIVLDFTSSTWIKHVLANFQGNTEIQGLALYSQFTNLEYEILGNILVCLFVTEEKL